MRHAAVRLENHEDVMLAWMRDHWVQYAAGGSFKGPTKVLEVNLIGTYRVRAGDQVLYDGGSMTDALETYNDY